jgi:hypothetical protein
VWGQKTLDNCYPELHPGLLLETRLEFGHRLAGFSGGSIVEGRYPGAGDRSQETHQAGLPLTGMEQAFFSHSLVGVSFLSLLVITEPNWGQLEIQKRHRIDRQKVRSGVLSTWVETPNPLCFFSLSLFFKALLLAVL